MSERRAPLGWGLGRLIAPAYGAVVARRNAKFDRGVGVKRAPVPVISVGNISVGGAGKSPHVRYVCKVLQGLGRKPAIVMRGYGAKVGGMSDEQAEHKALASGAAVIAHPNRYEAVSRMMMTGYPRADVAVLDDGFQHRRLARNVDLVLIDATRSPFKDRLLPGGWLREPVSSLARASGVVLTRADLPIESEMAGLRMAVERVTGSEPIAETRHAWADEMGALVDGLETTVNRRRLEGKRVVVACAIGNPKALLWQVRDAGAEIVESVVFRDHAPLGKDEAKRIAEAARGMDAVICTEKDWAKLKHAPKDVWPCPVYRPRVEINVLRGRAELDALIASALEKRKKP